MICASGTTAVTGRDTVVSSRRFHGLMAQFQRPHRNLHLPRLSVSVRATAVDEASPEAPPKLSTTGLLKNEVQSRRAALIAAEAMLAAAEATELATSAASAGRDAQLPNYGFKAATAGESYITGVGRVPDSRPGSVVTLARENFNRELAALKASFGARFGGEAARTAAAAEAAAAEAVDPAAGRLQAALGKLTLSNAKVWEREHRRPPVVAPWVIKVPYYALCYMLDALFDGRPIERFWFLEMVARMPYMSYISMLHLYETLGWWRVGAAVKRVHFAEEWNEFHHLLIMESLGGDRTWAVRFFALHSAIAYFWTLTLLWLLSPTLAYNFSELIEAHAVDTYGEFVDANAALLESLPPPEIAIKYYCSADMYIYDEFQTARAPGSRRPTIRSLRDVFVAIRDDEAEHVATMAACQDAKTLVLSPNVERAVAAAVFFNLALQSVLSKGVELASGAAGAEDAVSAVDTDTMLAMLAEGAETILKFLPFT